MRNGRVEVERAAGAEHLEFRVPRVEGDPRFAYQRTVPMDIRRHRGRGVKCASGAAHLLERAVHAAKDWVAPAKHPVHPLFYAATMVPGAIEALRRRKSL